MKGKILSLSLEILLVTVAFISCLLLFLSPFYIAGLFNLGNDWGKIAFLMILLRLGLLIIIILQICLVKFRLVKKILGISIIILILLFVVVWESKGPYANEYMRGFKEFVSNNTSISEIESWLQKIDNTESANIPKAEWPKSVKKLNPEKVYFSRNDDCCSYDSICLKWNSYLVSWGLTVTNNKKLQPEKFAHPYSYYVVSLEPGNYIWLQENK